MQHRKYDGHKPHHEIGIVSDDRREIGDLAAENVVAPEEKAGDTKGIKKPGKITLNQYLVLVGAGYDGDVVRRWTENHAAQEIHKRHLRM